MTLMEYLDMTALIPSPTMCALLLMAGATRKPADVKRMDVHPAGATLATAKRWMAEQGEEYRTTQALPVMGELSIAYTGDTQFDPDHHNRPGEALLYVTIMASDDAAEAEYLVQEAFALCEQVPLHVCLRPGRVAQIAADLIAVVRSAPMWGLDDGTDLTFEPYLEARLLVSWPV